MDLEMFLILRLLKIVKSKVFYFLLMLFLFLNLKLLFIYLKNYFKKFLNIYLFKYYKNV